MSEITDDFIFNLELYHDNPKDNDFIKKCDFFYNTLTQKKVNTNNDIKNPEETIKNLIFENVNYQKLCLKNEKFIKDVVSIKDKPFILVFDNMQLSNHRYKIICNFILGKKCVIYVPFIFLAEQSIKSPINIDNNKKMWTNKFIGDDYESIFFPTYKNKSNDLTQKYKLMADKIGLCVFGDKIKLLNYNLFFPFEKDKIVIELFYLNKYFISVDKNNLFYCDVIKKAHDEFNKLFITDGILDELKLKMCDIEMYENMTEIRKLIISFKEARDSYYIEEIKQIGLNNPDFNMLYITSDEISCIRCILNNISSLNIYGINATYKS